MIQRFALVLLAAFAAGILAGCEGDQVVKAPPKRPDGAAMSRGTTADHNGAPNQGN